MCGSKLEIGSYPFCLSRNVFVDLHKRKPCLVSSVIRKIYMFGYKSKKVDKPSWTAPSSGILPNEHSAAMDFESEDMDMVFDENELNDPELLVSTKQQLICLRFNICLARIGDPFRRQHAEDEAYRESNQEFCDWTLEHQ